MTATAIRIACISDTHGKHGELELPPNIDVLIHAGDFSRFGKVADIDSFNTWLGNSGIPTRIVVLGNHENGVFRKVEAATMLTNATAVLKDSGHTLDCGLTVWGTPFCWPMAADSPCPNPHFALIPDGADIVVAHGPAAGFVDGDKGCPDLARELTTRVKPKLFVCGHIHGAHGQVEANGTIFVNAASERYEGGVHPPIVVELAPPPLPNRDAPPDVDEQNKVE